MCVVQQETVETACNQKVTISNAEMQTPLGLWRPGCHHADTQQQHAGRQDRKPAVVGLLVVEDTARAVHKFERNVTAIMLKACMVLQSQDNPGTTT